MPDNRTDSMRKEEQMKWIDRRTSRLTVPVAVPLAASASLPGTRDSRWGIDVRAGQDRFHEHRKMFDSMQIDDKASARDYV